MDSYPEEPDQQIFRVFDPELHEIGVVTAIDAAHAILKIPPEHGIMLEGDASDIAAQQDTINDLNRRSN